MDKAALADHPCSQDLEESQIFQRVGRPVYIHIDLDAIVNNSRIIRKLCRYQDVGIMAVLKSDCYGHGAVQVARRLRESGAAERLAVATVAEGVVLRKGGITGPVHIFGNVQSWEMLCCLRHQLVPTVATRSAVVGMAEALSKGINSENGFPVKSVDLRGRVHVKVDTGLRRNGCQPSELDDIVKACDSYGVPLEGIFSHLANFNDDDFTRQQLKLFEKCTAPYKSRGLLLHIAASGSIIRDQGTDYDLVRPGTSLLGLPPGGQLCDVELFASLGFQPALEIKGQPTLVKRCLAGDTLGYLCAYTCTDDEWIATFPIGYADGYCRSLNFKGAHVRRDKTGELCPVVGKISMDAIMVKLPCQPERDEVFTIVTSDFHPVTSVMGICRLADTIPQEMLTRLSPRLPRLYTSTEAKIMEIRAAHELSLE